MIGRIVEIAEDGRHLFVRRGLLVVAQSEGERQELGTVPLDDIAALIVHAHGTMYSNNLLVALAERNAPFVLCAAGCFGASSPKLYNKLAASRLFGEYVRSYKEKTGISRKTRIKGIAILWLGLFVSAFLYRLTRENPAGSPSFTGKSSTKTPPSGILVIPTFILPPPLIF